MRCVCKKCQAVCTAVLCTSSAWEISTCKNGADAPCKMLLSSTPHDVVQAAIPAPPTLSIQTHAECCICSESCLRQELFECPRALHLLCQNCFEVNVRSQIREDLVNFLARDCVIVCSYCALTAAIAKDTEAALSFNMQQLIPR